MFGVLEGGKCVLLAGGGEIDGREARDLGGVDIIVSGNGGVGPVGVRNWEDGRTNVGLVLG